MNFPLYPQQNSQIPALGLGTYSLLGDTAVDIIGYALEIGYRHIDTAQFYGNEVEVGKAINESGIARKEIFCTTKVWPDKLGKSDFLPAVAESLEKLKMDYVDLLLIHWPNPQIPLEETLAELQKAQEMGYAKHIGVSNFNTRLLQQTLDFGIVPLLNQVEYHPFLAQQKLLSFQREHDILLTAYSPVAQGKVKGHPLFVELAAKYGKNEFQLCLAWLLQQEGVLAIPRSSKKANVLNNADFFDIQLTQAEMDRISALGSAQGRLVNPSFPVEWD